MQMEGHYDVIAIKIKRRTNKVEQKILDILQEIRPEFDFESSNDFVEDGYLDSYDVVTIVAEIEDSFGVIIDGTDILPENFSSIEKIAQLIQRSEQQ